MLLSNVSITDCLCFMTVRKVSRVSMVVEKNLLVNLFNVNLSQTSRIQTRFISFKLKTPYICRLDNINLYPTTNAEYKFSLSVTNTRLDNLKTIEP